MQIKRKIYIGTSGWAYDDWKGIFYPKHAKIPELQFYAQYFNTVEVNSSFYRLPSKATFKHWNSLTPQHFIFSIKASRYISHVKRLKTDARGKLAIRRFLKNASGLGPKLGVILVQLPSNFKANLERLESFITYCAHELKKYNKKTKIALEFRHESWFNDAVYTVLKKHKIALIISHSTYFPFVIKTTTNFAYIRLHGPGELYASSYSKKELENWKEHINQFSKEIKKVYVYFNNDVYGYAISNAQDLKKWMKQ
jgi:uncharacterized protein YecE (DUF72 family)